MDLNDIQGLLRFGYKHHTQACYLLLRIKDRDAARAWLAQAPVDSAVGGDPLPQTVLQVAFTCEGLRSLGVPADIVEGFSAEFIAGMSSDASRARRLGDVGANEASRWQWGVGHRLPHVLLLLYALPGRLEAWQRSIETQCTAGFDLLACLPTSDLDGVEPFGFVDGISQPKLDWTRERPVRDQDVQDYSNVSCLGEFLLGYPNEYGRYTDRPLLEPTRDGTAMLPRAEDAPDKADLGRNGSYLVMRQLHQDVAGFWQWLDRHAAGDPNQRTRLAEAMVGRTLTGEPLVGLAREAIAGGAASPQPDLNAFTYGSDPRGVRCPLGAHVRRTNPRNADLPPGRPGILSRLKRVLGLNAQARELDLAASTRFHRLLRRGREYGPEMPLSQALSGVPAAGETGLHFVCLNGNIGRQFEFVQSAWIAGSRFSGLSGERDPLVGHRRPELDGTNTDRFSMPQADGPDRQLTGLPQFVTVLGGAYFFLPGIRALRYLATAR